MKKNARSLALNALIAAVYAVLTLGLAPISYGPLQFRLSEALTVLPALIPGAEWGVFLGCLIANLLSPIGMLDIIFGSLATLAAALLTRFFYNKLKSHPVIAAFSACFMPVIVNALVIGALITFTMSAPGAQKTSFLLFFAQIFISEAAVVYMLGMPLLLILPQSKLYKKYILPK
ncbi:MAG: QueT transporter family protein [Candidatus Scatomorpha sp.]|jgi:uncharacterized membrane protein